MRALVSNVGFDVDAKELAQEYVVECYLAGTKGPPREVEREEER